MNCIGTQRSIALMHSLSATQAWQVATLPRGVVVQAFIAGSQLFAPHGVSSVAVHSTQVPLVVSHASAVEKRAQSGSTAQGAHMLVAPSQRASRMLVHCAVIRHSTQVWVVVSQWVIVLLQSLSTTQPTQVSVAATRQCDVAPAQVPLQGTCASPVGVPESLPLSLEPPSTP